MKRKMLLCITAVFLAAAVGVTAQEDDADHRDKEQHKKKQRKEIVVTATKTSIEVKETGASITVITEQEMEQKGKKTVSGALRDVPGLTVVATSPFGGITSVYIRGAHSGSSIVMLDGVRVNDPTDPNKSFDFASLMTDNIERIEVIRGTQSTLYGSDAMGGVINIISKQGAGDTVFNVWAEAGSYNTFRELAGVSGGTETINYSFSVSRMDSGGFNVADGSSNATSDNDGMSNTTIASNLRFKLFHKSRLGMSLRYINTRAEIEDGPAEDDPNIRTDTVNFASNVNYIIPVFSWWESTFIFSYMNIIRNYRDPADTTDTTENDDSMYKGTIMRGEWRNRFTIGSYDEILFGAEYEKESADTHTSMPAWAVLSSSNESSLTGAAYLQNHLKLFDRIFIIAGIRYTATEYYGDMINYSFSGSFIIPFTETRIKGNVGTGFKTPTLFQRFDPTYGNAGLDNETSTSYDAGIEQPLFDDTIIIGVTYFFIQYTDMVDFNTALNTYDNITDVDSQGAECFIRVTPLEDLVIIANYTYTWAVNNETDRQLVRRPEHNAAFNLNYSFIERGNINIGLNWIGERIDTVIGSWPTAYEKLSPYWRLDAAVSFWVLEELQIFARGENLLDQNYEEANGYNTAGISFYGGLRMRI